MKDKRAKPTSSALWKKLHQDVLRPPRYPTLLSSILGAGSQIGAMLIVVLTCIVFAFTNVVWRPYIYSIIAYSLAMFGFLNGYVTSRYLKFFGKTDLMYSVTISAVVLPIFLFSCLLLEHFFDWIDHIPNRISNKVMLFHAILVYLSHASLCYVGAR